MEEIIFTSAEQKREAGKALYFSGDATPEERKRGLDLIVEAYHGHDAEATYIVARLVFNGTLSLMCEDQTEEALSMMLKSANKGCIHARAFLNAYCENRYREDHQFNNAAKDTTDPLVDFNGKPIKIDRKGIRTPIDAVLRYEDGRNILKLSTNVAFVYYEELPDRELFEQAVYRGLLAWEGDYEVFGGQKLTVEIELTNESQLFDNLIVIPLGGDISSKVVKIANSIYPEKQKALLNNIFDHRRSFAFAGFKWRATSRKVIWIQSQNDRFDDYEELMNVAKHEFGHALGLGDLYESEIDSLEGVQKGSYSDLDSYAVRDRYYNLVMCDSRGPISNNDIEMVILAFKENKEQLYQPRKRKGKISSALGKGN